MINSQGDTASNVWKTIIFQLKGVNRFTTTMKRKSTTARYMTGWTGSLVAGLGWGHHGQNGWSDAVGAYSRVYEKDTDGLWYSNYILETCT